MINQGRGQEHSPNVRLAGKLSITDGANVKEGPKHAGELHNSSFTDEHDLIFGYPLWMVHQSLGAVGYPNQAPKHPKWALEITESRDFLNTLPEALVQLPHGRLDGVIVRTAEELIDETRGRRGAGRRGGVQRVGSLGE